ncbi:MAG: hypothetical protein ACYDEX_18035 [Mobilitalea sp.]
MRMNKGKKMLSLLLTVCMVFQLFGGNVFADAMLVQSDTFYVGGENASDGNEGTSSEEPFATMLKAAATINALGAGSYHIIVQGGTTETAGVLIGNGTDLIDVAITSAVTGSAINNAVTGSAIVMRGAEFTGHLFTVTNNASLTLGDSLKVEVEKLFLDGGGQPLYVDEASLVYIASGGSLTMYSNVTLRNNQIGINSYNGYGAGIYNEGTFDMYGGEISNCSSGNGGAVYNLGTFHLHQGDIYKISSYNGAILNQGTFLMEDGTIRENTAYYGAGVTNRGNFTMNGGSINNNTATDFGGGISNSNTLTITGGIIRDNSAAFGGAIESNGTLNLSGSLSMPAGTLRKNDLYLRKPITIAGPIISSEKIVLAAQTYEEGLVLLTGATALVAENSSVFEPSDSRYVITEAGALHYNAPPATYYVGGSNADDANKGTESSPFATLKQAILSNNNGKCTIIVQSDLEMESAIDITGNVTIKSNGMPWVISPKDGFTDNSLFYVTQGTLDLGNSDNTDSPDSLIFDGKNKSNFMNCLIEVFSDSVLNLYAGVTFKNNNVYSIIANYGIFNMVGGSFYENEIKYDYGVIRNNSSFHMTGGSIRDNKGIGLENEGTFHMSGGTISNNTGGGVYSASTFAISGLADISSDIESPYDVYLEKFNDTIIVTGDISNTIEIKMEHYFEGRLTLSGETDLIQKNYQKFVLKDASGSFGIASDGRIEYLLPRETYYVGGDGAEDNNLGTDGKLPFATIQKAVDEIGIGSGTVILQADIAIPSTIVVVGTVNLISDGSVHSITRKEPFLRYSDSGDAYAMASITGKLILGKADNSGNDENATLIFDGGSKDGKTAVQALIYNQGILELYSGVVLQNNKNDNKYDLSVGGIYNRAIVLMYGGVLKNNTGNRVGGYAGDYNSSFYMEKGSIRDNKGGIATGGVYLENSSEFVMDGGTIFANGDADHTVGGVTVHPGCTFILNGGSISENYGNTGAVSIASSDYKKKSIESFVPMKIEPSTFIMNGGSISGNHGKIGAINMAGEEKQIKISSLAVINYGGDKIFKMNGGIIHNNKGDLASIFVSRVYAKFSMSGSARITEGDNVMYVSNSGVEGITLTGPLNGASPVATVEVVNRLDVSGEYVPNYTVGTAILKSNSEYTFTAEDAAKIVLTNPDYLVNSVGLIGRKIKQAGVTISNHTGLYANGSARTVTVIVSDGEKTLIKDLDYKLEYKNNVNAGTATVTVEGIGDYAGFVHNNFYLLKTEVIEVVTPIPVVVTPIPSSDSEDLVNTLLPTEDLLEQIARDGSKNVSISVEVPNRLTNDNSQKPNLILQAEVLEAAKEADRNLSVTIKDESGKERYSWSFKEEELSNSNNDMSDINLFLELQKLMDNPSIMDKMKEENAAGLVIKFGHDGVLPTQATVRIYVGDQEGFTVGGKVFLYHQNPETGKLETLPYSSAYVIDEEGYITITILHCSNYVVLPQEADKSMVSSLRDQITVAPANTILYVGGAKDDKVNVTIQFPVTLEFVALLTDKTSSSAIGGVTVAYRSNKQKVATVNNDGKITAKGVGKATITTTITLYSGKVKTFKTIITVKEPYISLTESTRTMKMGDTFTFKAEGYGLELADLVWTTSEKSVILINKKTGVATAASKGTDYVVVSIGDIVKKVKVVVQ